MVNTSGLSGSRTALIAAATASVEHSISIPRVMRRVTLAGARDRHAGHPLQRLGDRLVGEGADAPWTDSVDTYKKMQQRSDGVCQTN
jgi:hypothetical protein